VSRVHYFDKRRQHWIERDPTWRRLFVPSRLPTHDSAKKDRPDLRDPLKPKPKK
jgi:hypothetical protein